MKGSNPTCLKDYYCIRTVILQQLKILYSLGLNAIFEQILMLDFIFLGGGVVPNLFKGSTTRNTVPQILPPNFHSETPASPSIIVVGTNP